MIKGYCKKHYNNEFLVIVMVYRVSNIFLKKSEFTSEVWYFHFSVSSRLHFGCPFLCQPSLVKLYYQLIDLNQDSKVIQGVK